MASRLSNFGGMGDSVTWRIVRSEGETVPIKVERDGQVMEFFPRPGKEQTKLWQRKGLRQIKIAPAQAANRRRSWPPTAPPPRPA